MRQLTTLDHSGNGKGYPHICFVGPMTGKIAGQVPTQGERLAELFGDAGYSVIVVSGRSSRYARFLEIVYTLLRRRHEIDVQCLQVFSGPSFVVEDVASWIGRQAGSRIVMCLRGGSLPEFISRYPRWSYRVLRRADLIVAPSDYLNRTVAKLGLTSEIIPNVLDFSRYPFRTRSITAPRLLWMRAFHQIYNPEMAVRVLHQLRASVPAATLTMAGPDLGMFVRTKKLAQELGVIQAIRFPGFLDMSAKIEEGDRNEIYLNTNRIDNMPVSVLEMAAMGLPIVSTAVGGINDLLQDNETGVLVPDDDAKAMAAAVTRLLSNPRLTERLSINGRKLAERCSWDELRPRWESAIREAWVS